MPAADTTPCPVTTTLRFSTRPFCTLAERMSASPGVSSYCTSTMRVPTHALDLPLDGVRLDGDTLREVTARGPVLLVFLRHFG